MNNKEIQNAFNTINLIYRNFSKKNNCGIINIHYSKESLTLFNKEKKYRNSSTDFQNIQGKAYKIIEQDNSNKKIQSIRKKMLSNSKIQQNEESNHISNNKSNCKSNIIPNIKPSNIYKKKFFKKK